MKWKVIVLTLLLALLAGCVTFNPTTTDECGYKWRLENDPIPRSNWSFERVPDMELYCGRGALSCARQHRVPGKPEESFCAIFLPSEDSPEMCASTPYLRDRHEPRHCAGEIHPGAEGLHF